MIPTFHQQLLFSIAIFEFEIFYTKNKSVLWLKGSYKLTWAEINMHIPTKS